MLVSIFVTSVTFISTLIKTSLFNVLSICFFDISNQNISFKSYRITFLQINKVCYESQGKTKSFGSEIFLDFQKRNFLKVNLSSFSIGF